MNNKNFKRKDIRVKLSAISLATILFVTGLSSSLSKAQSKAKKNAEVKSTSVSSLFKPTISGNLKQNKTASDDNTSSLSTLQINTRKSYANIPESEDSTYSDIAKDYLIQNEDSTLKFTQINELTENIETGKFDYNEFISQCMNSKPTIAQDKNEKFAFEIIEPKNPYLTNDEKLAIILKKYDVTAEQFDTIVATILAEATFGNYNEAYNIAGIFLNRIFSYTYSNQVEQYYGEGTGQNIYYHCIIPGNFQVYENGMYLKFYQNEEVKNYVGYQAIIDCFYSEEVPHNYVGIALPGSGYGPILEGCNIEFYFPISELDVIPLEERITYKIMHEEEEKNNNQASDKKDYIKKRILK